MGTLHGVIRDSVSGEPVEAKVHVLTSSGNFVHPADSILKVGPGEPFFYSAGEFTVNVPRGSTDIIVERGTEYEPLRKVVSAPQKGHVDVELQLKRWTDLPSQGWYPGNTHLHYSENEMQPDARLNLDPKVHDLSVTVVSILQRRELPYASNKYPMFIVPNRIYDGLFNRAPPCGLRRRESAQLPPGWHGLWTYHAAAYPQLGGAG